MISWGKQAGSAALSIFHGEDDYDDDDDDDGDDDDVDDDDQRLSWSDDDNEDEGSKVRCCAGKVGRIRKTRKRFGWHNPPEAKTQIKVLDNNFW